MKTGGYASVHGPTIREQRAVARYHRLEQARLAELKAKRLALKARKP